MREPKVVLPFGNVIGEFVAERPPDSNRSAGAVDHINAGDLRLLAAVEREGGTGQIALRRRENGTVALVEPLRLRAGFVLARLAAVQAELEHPHRVRELGRIGEILVHSVASLGGTE